MLPANTRWRFATSRPIAPARIFVTGCWSGGRFLTWARIEIAEDQINLRPGGTGSSTYGRARRGLQRPGGVLRGESARGRNGDARGPKPIDKPPLPNGGKLERYTPIVQNSALVLMAAPDAVPSGNASTKIRIVARPMVNGKLGAGNRGEGTSIDDPSEERHVTRRDPRCAAAFARSLARLSEFNFAREIGTILTRKGCNGASCHGGVKGRGGFKLSAGAFHPKEDYEWIVKGGVYQVLTDEVKGERSPRVNVARAGKEPAASKSDRSCGARRRQALRRRFCRVPHAVELDPERRSVRP